MSRCAICWLFLALVCGLPGCASREADSASDAESPIEVYFSAKGGCSNAVLGEIVEAHSTIVVQTASLASSALAQALVDARQRGVRVEVIVDKSQRTEKRNLLDLVARNGIVTRIDEKHAVARNLVMVVDGQVVVTGSFNFAKSAEQHGADHLLVIRSEDVAQKYLSYWEVHAKHSHAYRGHESDVAADTPAKKRLPVHASL